MPAKVDMDKIVSLCKRRGFIFQSSEIYGGLSSCWDYGPLGAELKRNVREAWWRQMVHERDDIVGLDASILMHPRTWEASGHLEGFVDPLVECKNCHQRFRPGDVVVAELCGERGGTKNLLYVSHFIPNWDWKTIPKEIEVKESALLEKHGYTQWTLSPTLKLLEDFLSNTSSIPCPFCETIGQFTEPRMFNLMFKTLMGPVEEEAGVVYMRPETAQGIFVNFRNVLNSTRKKLPFGIAQTGKAFRNEITPGNFIFRSREFEQMEMEFFVKPGTDKQWFDYWVQERFNWYVKLGITKDNLRLRPHGKDELAHYARDCSDVEYLFPMGWAELEGIANRGDFDLTQHSKFSGQTLDYFDEETGEHIVPYVIEPSAGVDRSTLAFLLDAYDEEKDKEGLRVVLHLHPSLAPVKVAVLPLSRNEKLTPLSREVYGRLRKCFVTQYDDAQSIGRRYRRQDEIGTPFSVTIDFQSLEDNQVTVRDRDSMRQIRLPIKELETTLAAKLKGESFDVVPAGATKWLGFEKAEEPKS